jgi:hypothetical protein
MNLSDVQGRVKQQLAFEDHWVVILEPQKETGPEANLLLFGGSSRELLRQFDPPVKDAGGWDGWVNFWVKGDKLFVGSWSGYQFELDVGCGELINGVFTK